MGGWEQSQAFEKVTSTVLSLVLIMAEYPDEGSPGVGEEGTEVGGGGNSDEYEPETMTAAEVLQKLEEVSCEYNWKEVGGAHFSHTML